MTVQELIDKLNKIENKELDVCVECCETGDHSVKDASKKEYHGKFRVIDYVLLEIE